MPPLRRRTQPDGTRGDGGSPLHPARSDATFHRFMALGKRSLCSHWSGRSGILHVFFPRLFETWAECFGSLSNVNNSRRPVWTSGSLFTLQKVTGGKSLSTLQRFRPKTLGTGSIISEIFPLEAFSSVFLFRLRKAIKSVLCIYT